jgi:hypothetical protein
MSKTTINLYEVGWSHIKNEYFWQQTNNQECLVSLVVITLWEPTPLFPSTIFSQI